MKWIDAGRTRAAILRSPRRFEGQPRQQLTKLYLREGSIYLTRRDVLMNQNSLKGRDCRAWIIPEERACNIDTPFDLFLAEQLMRRNAEHL